MKWRLAFIMLLLCPKLQAMSLGTSVESVTDMSDGSTQIKFKYGEDAVYSLVDDDGMGTIAVLQYGLTELVTSKMDTYREETDEMEWGEAQKYIMKKMTADKSEPLPSADWTRVKNRYQSSIEKYLKYTEKMIDDCRLPDSGCPEEYVALLPKILEQGKSLSVRLEQTKSSVTYSDLIDLGDLIDQIYRQGPRYYTIQDPNGTKAAYDFPSSDHVISKVFTGHGFSWDGGSSRCRGAYDIAFGPLLRGKNTNDDVSPGASTRTTGLGQ